MQKGMQLFYADVRNSIKEKKNNMRKIFTKEEAQKLDGLDAVHVWRDLNWSPSHCNVFIWKIYGTRLDVYGLHQKNVGLTWDTYGTEWLLSTPNNSYDKRNKICFQ